MMIGVVLDRGQVTLSSMLMAEKLVTLTAGETVLRLLPPLNLPVRSRPGAGRDRAGVGAVCQKDTIGVINYEEGPILNDLTVDEINELFDRSAH